MFRSPIEEITASFAWDFLMGCRTNNPDQITSLFYEGTVYKFQGRTYSTYGRIAWREKVSTIVPEKIKFLELELLDQMELEDLSIALDEDLAKIVVDITFTAEYTSIDDFSWKRQKHSCLSGSFFITADGRITPCPGLRDLQVGIVSRIEEVMVNEQLKDIWSLTKDKIKGCQKCHYRYICTDCRYVEWKLGNDIKGMKSCKFAGDEGVVL